MVARPEASYQGYLIGTSAAGAAVRGGASARCLHDLSPPSASIARPADLEWKCAPRARSNYTATSHLHKETKMSAMNATQTQQIVNGVNVDRLMETVGAVKASPELGMFHFRAQNRWIDGGHNRTVIRDFYGAGREDTSRDTPFVLEVDEPPVLLGENHGVNPVEYVLTALAGCLTTSLVYHAAARGIRIDEVESSLEGDLDLQGFLGISDEVRNGYQDVRVTFRIKADAPRETLEELCRVAQRRSPVFDIVSHPVPVTVRLADA
jgi:uncharacterized OsmC-like protein